MLLALSLTVFQINCSTPESDLTPVNTLEYYCCDINNLNLNDAFLSKNELETLKGLISNSTFK